MVSIDLFAEDQAHELFASALMERLLHQAGLRFNLNVRSAVGGHGRAISELKTYQRAVLKGAAGLVPPDLLVVMIDANCKGLVGARNDILKEVQSGAAGETLVACPDPHIERWLFADPEHFARVVGVDQQPGKRKCERDRYKAMLRGAVERGGHFSTLGGIEFTRELVEAMDLHRAQRNEPSLGVLIDGLQAFVNHAVRKNL
jgi:hypothetical protein